MTTGQLIKELRLKKGMTQEELAAITDISVRTIQRIENEEVDPRLYTLQTIAAALEINYEELANCEKKHLETERNNTKNNVIWLGALHLSGLFIMIFPPIIIWLLQKDKISTINEHATDVVNFQLSMFIYLICAGFLVLLVIGLPIVFFLGIFSTVIIVINTIKVLNNQAYKYPWTIQFLKMDQTKP